MSEEKLALKAALFAPADALLSWKELMSLKKFEEIENSTIRILPAIYHNLKNEKSVPDIDRLRGAYRVAWIKNTEYISTLIPILRNFEVKSIDYRILKGAALNFLFNTLGVRTMGDIDLIFRHRDMKNVSEILNQHGFWQVFSSSCPHRSPSAHAVDSSWINKAGIEIDLHIVEQSSAHGPISFFQKIMTAPAHEIVFSGATAKVPEPELMLIHAVLHGDQKVAISDQIQSLMDCSRLVRIINPSLLDQYCSAENCAPLVQSYLDYIYEIIGGCAPIKLTQKTLIPRATSSLWRKAMHFTHQVKRLPSIIQSRQLAKKDLVELWKIQNLGNFTYLIWLTFFQLRLWERWAIRFSNGFVGKVERLPAENLSNADFVGLTPGKFMMEAKFPKLSQEWRIKIFPDTKPYRIKVLLTSELLKTKTFLVFSNGKLMGVTGRNPDGRYEFELLDTGTAEISLRSPVRACEVCQPDLSDVKIFLRNIQ